MDLTTVMQGLALAGILANLGWAFRMNARMTKLESDVEHGFKTGRENMRRYSENLDKLNKQVHNLQLAEAARGGGHSDPSLPSHTDGP